MAKRFRSRISNPLDALASLLDGHDKRSRAYSALRLATDALKFVYNTGQWEFFEEYRAAAKKAPSRRAEHSFASMAEAESWLAKQRPGVVLGTLIKVGKVAYAIARDPSRLMLLRSVELDELEKKPARER